MMTLDEFRRTLAEAEPPAVGLPLRALWWGGRGEWARGHDLIDDSEDPDGMWVHAHLHRQGGDVSNARYWYDRAGKPEYKGTIDDEWASIASELLRQESNRGDR